jgi:hypothetical protein
MSRRTLEILNYLAIAAGLIAIAVLVYGIIKALI